MHWKQVDKGRAVGERDRRERSHVAQVVDLDERIEEIVATSKRSEKEGEREEEKDLELDPMVKKKLPVAWRSWTPVV